MENPSQIKNIIRKKFLIIRKNLSVHKRNLATKNLFSCLSNFLKKFSLVGSFYSINSEINTALINADLCSKNKLALPKIINHNLSFFKVNDLNSIEKNSFVYEPISRGKHTIPINDIEAFIIPGIAFCPKTFHRIGYGKGYYDRFLTTINKTSLKIGVGFEEQCCILPFAEKTDIPLSLFFLF